MKALKSVGLREVVIAEGRSRDEVLKNLIPLAKNADGSTPTIFDIEKCLWANNITISE